MRAAYNACIKTFYARARNCPLMCVCVFFIVWNKNLFVKYYSWQGIAWHIIERNCVVVVRLLLTHSLGCKRYTWNEKKRVFFLIFRLIRKLCTEMHWCNAIFAHTYTRNLREKESGWRSESGCVFYRFGMVDGCYIIWSNAKSKRKKHTEENKKKIERIDRVRLLNGWILHKKCNLNAKSKARRRRWFNTGNLQNSLDVFCVSIVAHWFLVMAFRSAAFFSTSGGRHFECAMCNIKIMCISKVESHKKKKGIDDDDADVIIMPKNRNLTKYFLHNFDSFKTFSSSTLEKLIFISFEWEKNSKVEKFSRKSCLLIFLCS